MSQQGVQKSVPEVLNPPKGSNQKKPGEHLTDTETRAAVLGMTTREVGGGVLGAGVVGTGYWVVGYWGTGCRGTGSLMASTGP